MADHTISVETDLILRALAVDSIEAICVKCGLAEQIVPLDEAIDEMFLANYHCEECDQNQSEDPVQHDLRDQK